MATMNCDACDEIRQTAPNLAINGIGDTECASLQNNTGLNPSSGHDDCEDLHNLNDCLVGGMTTEVAAYNSCDWKTFMKRFIPNVWTTLKAITCAICGIWTRIERLDCEIDYLFKGAKFNIKESEQTDSAYVVMGRGCSLYNNDSAEHTTDLLLNYIAGGLLRLSGSIYFYSGSGTFTDAKAVPNFDNGETMVTSSSRRKNSHWGVEGRPAIGGELIYEIRMKKSQYPQIRAIYGGRGGEANDGAYSVHFHVFDGDSVPSGQNYRYAYGQHGWCHDDGSAYTDATPGYDNSYDKGHRVAKGWIYIQCRMHWIDEMKTGDNRVYSPYGWLGIRTNREEVDC